MTITLSERIIQQKIKHVETFANDIPGVVILHNLNDWSVVWMSERGLKQLGVRLEEITKLSCSEYHGRFFNDEDAKDYVPKLFDMTQKNNLDDIVTFFQQVRLRSDADWTWHMSSTKLLAHDENGKALLSITIAFPIDAMHRMTAKAARLLEENNFLRRNFNVYSKLSKREHQILRLLAQGKSSIETADELFISLHTVETHRKNIKAKLGTNSYFELSQYARAFDLI
jgi:DNA-binding CsgD family transcriptional regulator